jgi:branched-subunit amino acid ABC-type transport system permease component
VKSLPAGRFEMSFDAALLITISTVATGLILGAIFALIATGVTIVYGSMGLPDGASGQYFILAALGCWSLATWFGLAPIVALLLVLPISIPLAYGLEALLFRRFYDVPERHTPYLVVTLGISQILTGLLSVTYGRVSDQFTMPPLVRGVTFIGPFPITNDRLVTLAVSLLLLTALVLLLRFHSYGRALRAVFQNRDAAAVRGVKVRAVYQVSYALGMLIIFVGGILYAFAYSFDLTVAWTIAVTAFAIMIIGGPGSVLGAIVIGMVFGFTQSIVSVFASPTVATFSYLLVMLLILLVKPSGLFVR